MGACYAASGKDLEAIGAWQTALIGETGSPTLYAVLGDALLRVHEADQALAILDEGLAQFPQDEGLRRRLGMAHAMAATRTRRSLCCRPGWTRTRRTRARSSRRSRCSSRASRATPRAAESSREQQRLKRYAKAYIDSQRAEPRVVQRWLRYLEPGG
jgi:predicted Zn-dependent protease